MVIETKTNATLDKIITTIGDLPASPAIVSTVMGLTSNLDTQIMDVSKVLSFDQSLTAKVLKLSNSSYYGRSKEVSTLEEAIPVLGFFAVRSMVVATSAHSMYLAEDPDGHRGKLWRHSLSSAVTARQIAKHVRYSNAEETFIASLLHDIGKLVLLQKLPDIYKEIVEAVERNEMTFTQAEIDKLGFDHCEVASVLLEHWSFPPSLIEAICDHHLPPAPTEEIPLPMSHFVSLGNELSKKMNVGFESETVENISSLPSAQVLKLDSDSLDEILTISKEHYHIEIGILD